MTYIHPLSLADLWILRGGAVIFSLFCAQFTLYPIFKKVVLEKSMSITTVLTKHMRFLMLAFAGLGILVIYPFYDLIPFHEYYSSSSFFIGFFALCETYISYYRVPFTILSPLRKKVVLYVVFISTSINIFRTVMDLVISIVLITGPWNHQVRDFYTFCKIVRMISAFTFTVSEFTIAKVTLDLISLPRSQITAEVRLQIKATKAKLEALALANATGAVTALVNVVNHWVENQMLHNFVVFIGAATFIFYGRLFQLGLDDKKEMDAFKKASLSESGSHSPTPAPSRPTSLTLSSLSSPSDPTSPTSLSPPTTSITLSAPLDENV
eukprot:Phypoly_transcript_12332.p1 GENE.Phypoly_transcript_12332~~Phypoly_transcript_12332.p1  ORF type:complete len:340 (+),score=49.97 Phypoly_transcript_12332:50-1021(+)